MAKNAIASVKQKLSAENIQNNNHEKLRKISPNSEDFKKQMREQKIMLARQASAIIAKRRDTAEENRAKFLQQNILSAPRENQKQFSEVIAEISSRDQNGDVTSFKNFSYKILVI